MKSPKAALAAFFLAAFAAACAVGARALTVEIKDIADDSPAAGLAFGRVDAVHETHHTAGQYLEIIQAPSRFRKVYLYTDNDGAFGIGAEGLVVPGLPDVAPVPLFWRAFPGHPGHFVPAEEAQWTPMLEKANPAFEALKDARARVPATEGKSLVGMGIKTQSDVPGGDYQARIVLEETSDVADITGPLVEHKPFGDVFLLDVPFGLESPVEDDGSVAGSTVYFRLDGQSTFTARAMTLAPDPANPFRWSAAAQLNPVEVHPGVLEYYFVAVDNFDNETQSALFRANLVPAGGVVGRPMTEAGGRVAVAIGDPAFPGVSLDFPADSLHGDQTITVKMRAPADLPDFHGGRVLRAFDFGPSGLRFDRPVTLAIPYLDQDQDGLVDGTKIDEKDLKIFWYDGYEWRFQGGVVNTLANQVRVQISHFSVYGIFPFAQALSADDVRPKEKIITPNGDGDNDFCTFNISGDFEVEFFNLRGDRVRRLSNINTWDGRGDNGDLVETGTYIYRLTGQGVTVTGMMAVAR